MSVVHSQYGYRASWTVPSVNLVHRWVLREENDLRYSKTWSAWSDHVRVAVDVEL